MNPNATIMPNMANTINAENIKQMFEGISTYTKEIIARGLKNELGAALLAVNKITNLQDLSPPINMVMNAFRVCDLATARVVLIGQDPYINPGEAMGLSFSTPRGVKLPPSLRNIYKCLLNNKLIDKLPNHGDLSGWSAQGVLLLNTALTTQQRTSNMHYAAWQPYTDALICELSKLPQRIVFIMLGKHASDKIHLIGQRHMILEWGHPSPLNRFNQSENPLNFKHCNAFSRANEELIATGRLPINWDPDACLSRGKPVSDTDPAPLTMDTLWLFTDGGSKANGRKDCVSSWAFYVTDGESAHSDYGIVQNKTIDGEVYQSSNNRGELSAIYHGLEYIAAGGYSYSDVRVVSDSEYSINCLDKWINAWIDNPEKQIGKKNLDIIIPAKKILDIIRDNHHVTFQHVRSHKAEPTDQESEQWFIWKCNDIVDRLCNVALGRV